MGQLNPSRPRPAPPTPGQGCEGPRTPARDLPPSTERNVITSRLWQRCQLGQEGPGGGSADGRDVLGEGNFR